MFKKGPDIDKKKLLNKALDVKKDSVSRLKHFKALIEHLEFNELQMLFRTHFSFIYHTFIDTFSTFDCNSKQRRDDLECILFMLEKILTFNPELIKKRWQFFSITFVMQKLLHINNTWQLRQEGIRLFVLWYQILCDDTNPELQILFASIVPGLVPQSSLPAITAPSPSNVIEKQQNTLAVPKQYPIVQQKNQNAPQLPITLCSIDPLVPMSSNEQLPNDEASFYLDSLLQCMITQTTKPLRASPDEDRKYQELGFSFTFNMFKKIYLEHIFPNFNFHLSSPTRFSSFFSTHSSYKYVDDVNDTTCNLISQSNGSNNSATSSLSKRDPLHIDLRQSNFACSPSPMGGQTSIDNERLMSLSNYQAIVIKWLTRILRQDLIPGQDELIRTSGSAERQSNRDISSSSKQNDQDYKISNEATSGTMFNVYETTSREMDIARRVIGTWSENIEVVHEIFRRAFLNYHQPASMKRVVNVYKEWICNGSPNQINSIHGRSNKLGYTSFSDLLQVFVLNSSSAFVTRVSSASMLDEQVEMCKRIMNIYRYMVMKIYMNTSTWEQLLNVMLSITERLFPIVPPEKKENTIGGRIAPAFFQTFIVSWIRANLYVHISNQMWNEFHRVMKSLVRWRELVEEWRTTMGSLTRVLVKHVYGLSLTDLPLDRPTERRRRPKAAKSLSTAESPKNQSGRSAPEDTGAAVSSTRGTPDSAAKPVRTNSVNWPTHNRGLVRSNSHGILLRDTQQYYSSKKSDSQLIEQRTKLRRIKSEYFIIESSFDDDSSKRSHSPSQNDVIDGTSLKDSNLIIEHDHALESSSSLKSTSETSTNKSSKKAESKLLTDKCVLLGGSTRGWTSENSVIMWRRMLGLFGNINKVEDPANHQVAIRCLESITHDFIKTRENLGISPDNQFTPSNPSLIPPQTYTAAWLLEATHLPSAFKESRLLAYELLCLMSIRRHDIELSTQYYAAFYEALYRALTSPDSEVHNSIIKNARQILTLELPGCTFLIQQLYERSRAIVLDGSPKPNSNFTSLPPRDQAIQILNCILALHRPFKKLMVLKSDTDQSMNLFAPGDIKTKVFETLLNCNERPHFLDSQLRAKSLCSLANHVYQEISGKSDSFDIEKLFDALLSELYDVSDCDSFRTNCDLLRLFADFASTIACSRPALVSSVVQLICQMIVRLSTEESNKELIHSLLICLEDWCLALGKVHLLKPIGHLYNEQQEEKPSTGSDESLITIVLRSLESVINNEQFVDDAASRARGSVCASRNSDAHSSGHNSQGKNSDQDNGPRDRLASSSQISIQQNRSQQHDEHNLDYTAGKSEIIKNLNPIKLACKVSHHRLVTYLGHFPLKQVGAASLSCCVSETDFYTGNDGQEMTDFNQMPGCFVLVIDGSTIVSFIGSRVIHSTEPSMLSNPIHLIVRNLCGKYSWNISCLAPQFSDSLQDPEANSFVLDLDSFQESSTRGSMKYESEYIEDGHSSSSMSSRASSNRDCIGDILHQLSLNIATSNNGSSITSFQNMQRKRNSAQSVCNPRYKIAMSEETMIALLTNQRFQELNYCEKADDMERVVLKIGNPDSLSAIHDVAREFDCAKDKRQQYGRTFEQCRQLIQQLGYLSWDKRCKVDSLAKNPRLLRELKNLDSQSGRDTHKIAVIYVAHGQEDKNSILKNSTGSRAFEDFVSGLGWEINLASHLGFRGGLQANKSTGETSPYYCNGTTEVMFHVSTRIPLNGPADDESLNKKLRHLGNDEIHIVWSEHSRDYRRGIIPTEFGDVIIAIYPMLTFQGYFRIQISNKQDVPMFGPLFDNCIVHQTSLAPLVRATAINASRAKRLKMPYYQSHFEERSRLIDIIVQNHMEKLSFEEFALNLYDSGEAAQMTTDSTVGGAPVCCT